MGNAWISLGRGNRIDFTGGQGTDRNRGDQVWVEGESTGKDNWNWGHLGREEKPSTM